MTRATNTDQPSQSERFKEAVRELGTDDDPEHFKALVQKLAKAPPAKSAEKPKKTD